MKNEDKCCGNCCWFYGEDTYGYGSCPFVFGDLQRCDKPCRKEEEFVSKKEMRHHLTVLKQHNRWRRSNEVPNHCRMVNPTELGKAIDFVVHCVEVRNEL